MDDQIFISHSTVDKAVADAVCHRLEENGFRCWIAPRDVDSTDWAGSIMKGIHRSEIFVVVISHDAVDSPEVLKEVTEATKTCGYLLPFKVDQNELSDRFRFHLGPCHWLDAVTPPLEQRIEELVQRILHLSDEDAVYMNSGRYSLLKHIEEPRPGFLGRDAEIEAIAGILSGQRILFLRGMGGIGKSEIAKGYAAKHKADYDTVIFAPFQDSLESLICSEALPVKNLRRAEKESSEIYCSRKLDIFQKLADERTLLIVDNFDVDGDPKLEELLSMPCKLLFTTRNDWGDYPVLDVGPLQDFDSQRALFSKSYGFPIAASMQPYVDEMLCLVGGHTITIELIARQMKASFKTPKQMLELIRNFGVNTHLKEKLQKNSTDTAFDCIQGLFSVAGLDEEALRLLRVMTFVPPAGISVPLLGEMLELDSFDAVNDLIAGSWLMLDEDGMTLKMHPVICDVIRDELTPDPENCKEYVRALGAKAKGFWGMDPEIRDSLYGLVRRLLDLYPVPTRELFAEYGAFANAGWICGDYERSQNESKVYYDFALKEFGPGSLQAGLGATYTAASYYNSGDWEGAGPWYERSFLHQLTGAGLARESDEISAILDAVPCREELDKLAWNVLEQLYAVCTRVGRTNVFLKDFEKAEKAFDLAMAYAHARIPKGHYTPGRKYPGWYAGIFQERERLYLAQERWEKAYEQCGKTYALLEDDQAFEEANMPFTLMNMARACSHLGRFEEAAKYLEQAKEITDRMIGPHSRTAFNVRDAAADSLLLEGRKDEALSLLGNLELDLSKYMGEANPETLRVKEKIRSLTAEI